MSRTAASARASLSPARASASSLPRSASRAARFRSSSVRCIASLSSRSDLTLACAAAAWPSLAASAAASAAARRSARATARRSDSASRARDAASSSANASGLGSSGRISTSRFAFGAERDPLGPAGVFSTVVCRVCGSSRLDAPDAAEDGASPSPSGASRLAAYEMAFATVAATSSSSRVGDFGSRFFFPFPADDASSAFGPSAVTPDASGFAGGFEATRVASTTEVVAFDARDDDPATSPCALPRASSARVGSRSSRLLSVPVTTAAFSVTFAAAVAVPSAVSLTSSPPSFRASVANSLNPSFSCAHMTAARSRAERSVVETASRTPPLVIFEPAVDPEPDAEVPGNQGG